MSVDKKDYSLIDFTMDQIKQDEGLSLTPYLCPAGKLTIGYGRNLESKGISTVEAERLLFNDVTIINSILNDTYKFYKYLSQTRRMILINMTFQLGYQGFSKFRKTINFLELKQYDLASKEMLNSKWAKQTPNRAKYLSNLMKGEQ